MEITDQVSAGKSSLSLTYVNLEKPELVLRLAEIDPNSTLIRSHIVLRGEEVFDFFNKIAFLQEVASKHRTELK